MNKASPTAEELLTDLGALKTDHGSRHHASRRHHPRRPQDARLSGAPALLPHAARRAGIRLRLSGRARRRAHPGRDLLLRNVDRDTARLREDLLGEKASSDFWILMRA